MSWGGPPEPWGPRLIRQAGGKGPPPGGKFRGRLVELVSWESKVPPQDHPPQEIRP